MRREHVRGDLELAVARPSRAPSVLAAARVSQWAHFLVLPLAGLDASLDASAAIASAGRGVTVAACVLAYGYLLNGLADARVDRDRAKNPLAGFAGPTVRYRIALVVLATLALSLAALGPAIALGATFVALASGTIYSVGPRLKRLPGVGTLLNASCFAPLLFVGLPEGSIAAPRWALALAFVGLLLQNQLVHEAADANEDRAGSVFSSYLVLGPVRAALFALMAGITVAVASAWLVSATGAPLLLASHALPYLTLFPWLLARRGADVSYAARLRRAHRVASLASGAILFAAIVLGS